MVASPLAADALDAYVYGYPIVLMETTRGAMRAGGLPPNRFAMEGSFPGPGTGLVVRPNVDTLYLTAWLDLSLEPEALRVPDTNGKYYVLQFLDAWTNAFASVGPRTTGGGQREFLVVGPRWGKSIPGRLGVIRAPTDTVWLIGRIQTDGPADIPLVSALQQEFLITQLGYWARYGFSGVTNMPAGSPAGQTPRPARLVEAMDAEAFFGILAAAMQANPPKIQDLEMNRMLARLGLSAGSAFDFRALPEGTRLALSFAAEKGPGAIRAAGRAYFAKLNANGWSVPLGAIGNYGTDYTLRAVAAMELLGANPPQDAVYGFSLTDRAGRALTGAESIRVHFASGRFPPARAFWSVTLYGPDGFLTENPIERYALAPHLGNVRLGPDGSLDILIRHEPPEKPGFSNWLPAPAGPFNLLLRIYWPDPSVLDGSWRPPPVLRA